MSENQKKLTEIGSRLKLAREEAGLTQEQFAERYGYARSTLGKLEAGLRDFKSTEIIMLAKQLGMSCDYLLGVEDEKTHVLNDLKEATGLTGTACDILANWNDTNFNEGLKALSFLIEHGHDFLKTLYKYLFIHYFFAKEEVAASFVPATADDLSTQYPLVTITDDQTTGRSIIDAAQLNDMHLGTLTRQITGFKGIVEAEKIEGKNGAPS